MQFNEGSFYHIYNRGNNKQRIFFSTNNYRFFLNKVERYISPNCDILSWALMPNHFHFLVRANEKTIELIKHTPIEINALTEGIRLLLSSYTKAIQKQEKLSGNLFQQKTKAKCVDDYCTIAFHYIHQNPLKARLAKKLEAWEFSSFREYLSKSDRSLCATEIAYEYLDIEPANFVADSHKVISDDLARELF
ncbi:MAG: transposase [Cyclobacteriaceae bacterium]